MGEGACVCRLGRRSLTLIAEPTILEYTAGMSEDQGIGRVVGPPGR